jgi:hypothetical protein
MWFTENPWPGVVAGGLLALGSFILYANAQRPRYLTAGIIFALLAGLCYLLERSIVTDGERAIAVIEAMANDFQQGSPRTLDYVSQQSPDLRAAVFAAMSLVKVDDDLRLTDFRVRLTSEASRAHVHFRANATLSVRNVGSVGRQPARFEVTLAREQGDWKLLTVKRLHPIKDEELGLMSYQSH